MSKDNVVPVIIVKKHGKHKHAHHGGSWKVAFADFATAMMAFFLVMWLLGGTSDAEKKEISEFFLRPEKFQPITSLSTAVIVIPQETKIAARITPDDLTTYDSKVVDFTANDEGQRMQALQDTLQKEVETEDSLRPFKDQILVDITPEGLRIQILDTIDRSMFKSGSADLEERTAIILQKLAVPINLLPNKLSISGHTDINPYVVHNKEFSNWELSADRANSARRALIFGGLDEEKIARVVGLSSTQLFHPEDPSAPGNRRITIVVLNKATENSIAQGGEGTVQLKDFSLPKEVQETNPHQEVLDFKRDPFDASNRPKPTEDFKYKRDAIPSKDLLKDLPKVMPLHNTTLYPREAPSIQPNLSIPTKLKESLQHNVPVNDKPEIAPQHNSSSYVKEEPEIKATETTPADLKGLLQHALPPELDKTKLSPAPVQAAPKITDKPDNSKNQ